MEIAEPTFMHFIFCTLLNNYVLCHCNV